MLCWDDLVAKITPFTVGNYTVSSLTDMVVHVNSYVSFGKLSDQGVKVEKEKWEESLY